MGPVFIDMDGVLVDFVSAAFQCHGGVYDEEVYPKNEWNISTVLGITDDQFWAKIDAEEPNFWPNIKPYPWTDELVGMVGEDAVLLSTPSRHPSSHHGKRVWASNNLPKNELVLCKSKHLVAQKGRILIDDNDGNIEKWRAAGGIGILFPQPWNKNHGLTKDRIGFVRCQLAGRGPAETRYTDSETGGQKGVKPERMELIPQQALLELARVYGFGAGKYSDWNYLKGYRWGLSVGALQRHLTAWSLGEDKDQESGLSHLAHVAWHAFTLQTYQTYGLGTDDRIGAWLEGKIPRDQAIFSGAMPYTEAKEPT